MWENFLNSFIPLFVAFDIVGVLPFYAKVSLAMDEKKRGRVLRESIVTAFLVALGFMLVGRKIMTYLGISIEDFFVAGGAILFVIAAKDLVSGPTGMDVQQEELFGVVPLGVPLLSGPAVFATSLILFNSVGFYYTFVSLVLNLLICGIVFRFAHPILRLIGKRWLEAISKVFALILASIAVMFIRKGLQGFHLP
jgi:multiple antibiotic resistance protein